MTEYIQYNFRLYFGKKHTVVVVETNNLGLRISYWHNISTCKNKMIRLDL
jgi:hypothetical protein